MRCPADFDRDWVLGFLRARTVLGLEVVRARTYFRAVATPRGPTVLEASLTGSPGTHVVRARAGPELEPAGRRRLVTRLFDLDTDLGPFLRLVGTDPLLGPAVARRPGIRRPLILEPFEGVVRAVVGQQVSVAAAATVIGRIVSRFGGPGPKGAGLLTFPTADRIRAAGQSRLAAVGLTGARARSIVALASISTEGGLDWTRLATLPADEAQRTLEDLPGIGPWTAAYLRMRVLGDPDAFPATDLGVIRALERHGVPRAAILARAERWRPWRAYATLHLWALDSDR